MWFQLYSSQFHYAVYVFGALVYFAAAWLYLDAYTKNHAYLKLRIGGFFLLAVGSLIEATQITIGTASVGFSNTQLISYLSFGIPILGFLCIFLSFPFDPIQNKPTYVAVGLVSTPIQNALVTLLPLGSWSVAIMYYMHVAEGLEWHLLLPSLSFGIIGISELFHAARIFTASSASVYLMGLGSMYGLFWWVEHIVLLVGLLVLIRWIFWYLLKSFEMQMVFIAAMSVSVLTLIITTFFSYNLFENLLKEISHQSATSVKVFSFSIESKKRQAIADARFIALDTRLASAVMINLDTEIQKLMQEYAISRGTRGLIVLNAHGNPIIQNDQDSIFFDLKLFSEIIRQSSLGIESSSMVSVAGIVSPTMYMVAGAPIRVDSKIVGSLLLTYALDSAITEGIKKDLGLEGALFAGDRLSVTSMSHGDALIGMKETNPAIIKQVLVDGKSYEGIVSYNTSEYLGSYLPVMNAANTPIGMMYVGRSIGEVFSIVNKAIQDTFIVSTLLLVCSIIPALYIAKYITYQVH